MLSRLISGLRLRHAAFVVLVLIALPSAADELCGVPDAAGARRCYAGLSVNAARRIVSAQQKPQWCWAASISMIFAHYGFVVEQSEVVNDSYGAADDLPAASGDTMTRALSKDWIAQGERAFHVSAITSDRAAMHFQLTNEMVLEELAAGRPLLIGVQAHAMVLIGLQVQRLPGGAVRIVGGAVLDPAPGQGLRELALNEMRPTYIAAVRIRAEDQSHYLVSASSPANVH